MQVFATSGVSKRISIYEYSAIMANPGAETHCPSQELGTRSKLSCLSWNKYYYPSHCLSLILLFIVVTAATVSTVALRPTAPVRTWALAPSSAPSPGTRKTISAPVLAALSDVLLLLCLLDIHNDNSNKLHVPAQVLDLCGLCLHANLLMRLTHQLTRSSSDACAHALAVAVTCFAFRKSALQSSIVAYHKHTCHSADMHKHVLIELMVSTSDTMLITTGT